MKKILSIIFLALIFIMPFSIKVEAKSYDIDSLKIKAEITEIGNVDIEEELSYSFQGDFNGVYRNLEKKGCNGYEISSISLKDKNNNIIPLKKGNGSENNTYQINESSDKTEIKIFSKSNDELKTFILNYTVLDAAKRYNSFSELNWNFYKVEKDINVKSVDINLSLKNSKFNMDNFKYDSYLDGGKFTTNYDENRIHLYGDNLTSLLGIKVQFQPEFLNKEPIPYEDNLEKSNNSSESQIPVILILIIIIVATSIGTFVYSRNIKKLKEAVEEYREEFKFFSETILENPPNNLSPTIVNLLYNTRYIMNSTSIIPVTIFYLCKKGYYVMGKREVLNDGNVDEVLYFKRNKKISIVSEQHLRYFMEWMSLYEKKGVLTFNNIEKSVDSNEGAVEFKEKFSKWEDVVKEDFRDLGYYITIVDNEVLSNEALNEKLKWMAYRKYIINHLEEHEDLEGISNVEEALIYGAALEIDKIQAEDFTATLKGDGNNDYSLFLAHMYIWSNIDSDLDRNIQNNSNNNDSFGGFSSGSDFSGGGGGGSGAF